MGLTVNSGMLKTVNSGIANQTSPNPAAEIASSDFSALLSQEIGNLLSTPTEELEPQSARLKGKTGHPDLTADGQSLQIDPSLIASLNATAIKKIYATDTETSDKTTDQNGIPQLIIQNTNPTEGITNTKSLITDTSTKDAYAEQLLLTSGKAADKNHPPITSNKTTDTNIPTTSKLAESSVSELLSSTFSAGLSTAMQTQASAPQKSIDAIPSNSLSPINSLVVNTQQNSLSAPTQTEIKTQFTASTWSQNFNEKIVWLAKSDIQSAQININPPELGPVQITLNLSGDQAKLAFASPHLDVRQAIENALPQLKDMLSTSGISLGQTDIGANMQQQQRELPFQKTNSGHMAGETAILPIHENVLATSATQIIKNGRGLVDLFA